MKSILILFHCESNTGYAIGPLERSFYEMALVLSGRDASRIHVAYPSMRKGPSPTLPVEFTQYAVINAESTDTADCRAAERYIQDHGIDTIFGFDQPVSRPIYRYFRRAGVRHFISYWGAPMSSMKSPAVRLVKRVGVILARRGPDHYIFESHGMAQFAVMGRGIPRRRTSVVPLGIDTVRFRPDPREAKAVYERLAIPGHRRVFFYSGHMEPRKGVAVIMEAANRLSDRRANDDWHILLCGDRQGENADYLKMLGQRARDHVTFGGYRSDLELLQRGCYAAVIASTGWDSFPRSALEMQASGLPLLASDLMGLRESLEDGVSGVTFPTGDADALAAAMERLLNEPQRRDRLSLQARARIENGYSLQKQLSALTEIVCGIVTRNSER